jgi:hypothetical protein
VEAGFGQWKSLPFTLLLRLLVSLLFFQGLAWFLLGFLLDIRAFAHGFGSYGSCCGVSHLVKIIPDTTIMESAGLRGADISTKVGRMH